MKHSVNVPLKQSLKDNPTLQSLKQALEIEMAYKQRQHQKLHYGAKKGAH